MTLCIAAACINDETGQPAIVLCSDMMESTDISSSETMYKHFALGPYVALISGVVSESRKLLSFYADYFKAHPIGDSLSESVRAQHLAQGLNLFKRQRIENLVQQRIGLTYVEFLERSTQVDPIRKRKISEAIDELPADVDVLFANVTAGTDAEGGSFLDKAFIFRQRLHNVEPHGNFACIGDGTDAAEQSLHRRKQSPTTRLSSTLYHVYEAKKMSEQAPTVGEKTVVSVMATTPGSKALGFSTRLGSSPARWSILRSAISASDHNL
jgi:hypothetical protein